MGQYWRAGTKRVKARDLKLADVVSQPSIHTWGTSVVKNITGTEVVLFRPYGVAANFSYTGGVLCYTGVEIYTVSLSSDYEFDLLERKVLL